MEPIHTTEAPVPLGPYSQALAEGGLLFVSGQIPVDPTTGRLAGETIEDQARQVLRNLEAVLRAGGSDWGRVLRVTVYMTDLREFARFNTLYEQTLGGARPARSTVQVVALPLEARLEIDAIAAR
ncbi:MAG: RidA family protein [Myxococcota bacterium]